jgi:aldose 1-epimerase
VSTDRSVVEAGGIDHTFVLADAPRASPELGATLVDPASGRRLEVWTTEPALQVYTGNDLDGSLRGPSGIAYERRAGIALEAQHAPDSPNLPSYPSTVLRPGQVFESTTAYRLFF